MNVIETFKINSQDLPIIEVVIPFAKDKINYAIEPTEELNQFDIVQAIYQDREQSIVLSEERLGSLLHRLYESVKLNLLGHVQVNTTLKGKLSLLDDKLRYQKISYDLKDLQKLRHTINESFVWSCPGVQVMLYGIDNRYYLEISSYYGWTGGVYKKKMTPFEEYERNYRPIVVDELSKGTLENWQKQCEKLLKKIDCWYGE